MEFDPHDSEAEDATDADLSSVRVREAGRSDAALAFHAFIEAIAVPAWIHDVEAREVLAVNDAMISLTKRTRQELIGSSTLDLFDPADHDVVQELLDQLLTQAVLDTDEPRVLLRLAVPDGRAVRAKVSSRAVPAVRPHARLAIAHEIASEVEREMEADLVRRARVDAFRGDLGSAMMADEPLPAHFDRVLEAMEHHLDLDSVGIWVLDEATGQLHLQASVGTVDTVTAGGHRIGFGETWIGRAASRGASLLLDTWDPAMRPLEVANAQEAGVTHVGAFPLIVRRRVLGVVTVGRAGAISDEVVDLLRATATQIAQALGTAFAYEALRVSESLSRSVLANMLSPLVTLSEEGVIETANPAAVSTFGYSRDELIGRPLTSLLDVPRPDPKTLIAHARGRATPRHGRRKNGEVFPCELRLFQLESLRGPGYGAILEDVSERFEVERLKAEFVSVVSHELRTPLTALRGSIGLLTGGVLGALPEEVLEMLHIAERNALRLISLVNDILDLERLEKGKLDLFIEPVRARLLVERSIESVKPYADQEAVTIEARCDDCLVLGDSGRLVQVLVNLLSNAVKFSAASNHVQVSTSVEPKAVVFRVTDHGRGIPPSHRRIIFERFEQVRTSDAREKGGTGLGLAISKAIVEQHDGEIGVDSQEGVGSTFWFRVPRAG